MSRYVYSCCEADGCLLLYLESTVEEDKLDMVENQMAVGFTGNGYLAFWKRCKERERGLLAAYPRPCRSVITDTYTGEEKVWWTKRGLHEVAALFLHCGICEGKVNVKACKHDSMLGCYNDSNKNRKGKDESHAVQGYRA